MGCYGIGISRILAAVVEQNHDDEGIVWPAHLAPFQVVVIMAGTDDERVRRDRRAHLREASASAASRRCSTIATSARA